MVAEAVAHVDPRQALEEMRAQIDVALAAGIDVTHIDTHMGTVVHPRYLLDYLALGWEYGVPAFLPRPVRERLEALPQSQGFAEEYVAALMEVSDVDILMLDAIVVNTLVPLADAGGDKRTFYEDLIRTTAPGLTHLLYHPALAGDELAGATGTWETRSADHQVFSHPSMRDFIEGEGIRLIGYRELRGALPA